jgi:branched-chain amino acid transport system ATP-binding protein
MLSVEAIHTFYGESHILHGVSLQVQAGELVAVLGRNGAGKTTTMSSIIGLIRPRKGAVIVNGRDVTGQPPHVIASAGVGLVPQGRRIFAPLSVKENLVFAERRKGPWTLARVYALFPRLAERQHNRGSSLSGGEQQMLAIGRALLGNPKLLIMDEPSEGLAPTIVEQLIETCKTLEQEGVAILLIEQNLGVSTSLAERQLVMVAGSIALETTAEKLLADPEAQRRFLGVEPVAAE